MLKTPLFLLLSAALSLAASGCSKGCGSPGDVTPKSESQENINAKPIGEAYLDLPLEDQLASIALDSQRAGHVAGNLDDHINPWNDKAKLTELREAEKEKYAQVFDLKQLESARRILFSPGGVLATDLTHSGAKATVNGEEATLSVEATHVYGDIKYVYDESYTFKKSERGWEITGLTRIPTKIIQNNMETAYSRGYFVRLDTAVSVAKKSGDKKAYIDALEKALRYAEAYAQRGKLIKDNPDVTAEEWLAAARLAMKSGHITSAMRCYEKANTLDPKLQVPEAGLAMRKIRGDREYTDDELKSMREPPPGPDEYTPDAADDATDSGDATEAENNPDEGTVEPPDLKDEGTEAKEAEEQKAPSDVDEPKGEKDKSAPAAPKESQEPAAQPNAEKKAGEAQQDAP